MRQSVRYVEFEKTVPVPDTDEGSVEIGANYSLHPHDTLKPSVMAFWFREVK